MPLPLPCFEISKEGFWTMPHRIGWKHEYLNGQAQLSPAHTAVARLQLDLRTSGQVTGADVSRYGLELSTVRPGDEDSLIQLHIRAFDDAVEYAGYDPESYTQNVTRDIQAFFGGGTDRGRKPGDLNGSCVAVFSGEIFGALLLRKSLDSFRGNKTEEANDPEWEISPVMVDADHERQGLGRAMLSHACDWLRANNFESLASRCHLSKTTSLTWHAACGFVEQPTSFAASHRAHHHRWMHRHHQAAGRNKAAEQHLQLAKHHQQLYEVCSEQEYGIPMNRGSAKKYHGGRK